MDNKKLAKAAGALMVITILSKVVGFFRDSLIASAFGATGVTDAYNIAITAPSVIYGLFGGAITTVFIPLLSESYAKGDKEDAFNFANTILNMLFVFSVILFAASQLFAPQLVKLLAPKFAGGKYDLALELTRISVINIVLITMNSCYTAILQVLDEFVAPAFLGFITSLPIIIYIIFGAGFGIQGLTVVMVAGTALQVIFQIPWLLGKKFSFRPKFNLRDARLGRMMLLIAPVLVGSGVSQINTLVDRNMASGLPDGNIAALGFANIVNNLVSSIFITAIVTVIYPTLARVGIDKLTEFRRLITRSINSINLIVLPSAVGLMVLRYPIISVLFRHGKFDERAVELTSGALLFYSIGLVFIGVRDVMGKAFYALQDTKTPMINAIIGIIMNIVLNLLLVKSMGIRGLALATSVSAIVCALLLLFNLIRRIGGIGGSIILKSSIKIGTAAWAMGITVYFIEKILGGFFSGRIGEVIALFLTIVIGIGVYFITIVLLKVDEFSDIFGMIRSKLGRKSG